jgi:Secretion system C-terminal sorting domain
MSRYHKIIIGLMIPIILALAAPGDSSLYESFTNANYPYAASAWPEGWRRFSLEVVLANYTFWQRYTGGQVWTPPASAYCPGFNGISNNDWMITRMVYPSSGDTLLRFGYRGQNNVRRETLEVWVSTTSPDPSGMTTRLTAFGFASNSWNLRTVNLSAYVNTPIYLGIHFCTQNPNGVYIDSVLGPKYPSYDVAPTSITAPGSNFLLPASFTPSAVIKNYGSQSPADNFAAACSIYNASGSVVYNSLQDISPLLPNNTTTVSFTPTTLIAGNYTMAIRTMLDGDWQAINDRMTKQLTVVPGTEKLYDDGNATQVLYANFSGNGNGVKFTPSSYPILINGAEVMLSHDAFPPQPSNNIFRIRVVADTGSPGAPGSTLWESSDLTGLRGTWNYVPIPELQITSGSYYIFWIQRENYTQCVGLGADGARNAPTRTEWNLNAGNYTENTLLPGDFMIRSVENPVMIDVGTTAILSPPAIIDSGVPLIPKAMVKNFGNVTANFPVRFTIDDWSSDTSVANLLPNDSIIVDFASWVPSKRGTFAIKCSTQFTSDTNHINDALAGSVLVRVRDVQVVSIEDPTGTVNQGAIISPKATILNNGNTEQTFDVLFTISGGYSNTQTVTLGPGASQQVTFADWTAGPLGLQTVKCTTQLNGDVNTTNDQQGGSVLVQNLDVQCLSIDAPTGNVNQGAVIVPKATIRNNGNTEQTCFVVFLISGGYSNTQTVTLGPGASQQVDFADWTAGPLGMQTVQCTTRLAGDMNPDNDMLTTSVFVQGFDVQPITIVQPTGIFNQGDTLTPQATVKNNGNTTVTLPVLLTVGDGYSSNLSVTISPGIDTTVSFNLWTANTFGSFPVKCSTGLIGDMNTGNDTISGSILVQNLDAQCLSIDAPTGTITQGTVITPKATIQNNGNTAQTFDVLFTIAGGYSNAQSVTLGPGTSQQITFTDWMAGPIGSLGVKCTTKLAGDMNTNNDKSEDSVIVQSGAPAPSTWVRLADIPAQPSGKNPKAGSCMTGLNNKIYYLKASNTQDFFIYTPDKGIGTWTSKTADTMPIGTKVAGDGKKPKKGASMTSLGSAVYVLRGNNTPGFWKYETDSVGGETLGWHKLANIPAGVRNPKDASGLLAVNQSGNDYIFAMKGSKTDEFYLYDIANNTWTPTSTKPATGNSGKFGYKKGSCFAYDGNNSVYVLKGNYGDFFRYDLASATWTELKRYNHKFFINRSSKKKKVGEGSGIVYCANAVFLLKGGNTLEFWKYEISKDTWIQMNPSDTWDIPTGDRNKKVKGGGSLIIAGDNLYATKGAGTPEFYRHTLPTTTIALLPSQPTSNGAMGNSPIQDGFKLSISPNPAKNITALKYNLPASGPISLNIYNIAGVMVKSYTNPASTKDGIILIDAKTLSSGIYILRFNSGTIDLTRKLVIER